MTDRVYQDENYFEVSDRYGDVEVYVFDPKTSDRDRGEVMIGVAEDRRNSFTMTAEEATMLKDFLIRKGY